MPTVKIGLDNHVAGMRNAVKPLLPDFCRIVPRVLVESDSGAWEEVDGEALFYRNSQDIPCRLDPTAHHREEDVFVQEKIVNEYSLWIPADAPIAANHKVFFKEKVFDIRKVSEEHTWALLKFALVVEVV